MNRIKNERTHFGITAYWAWIFYLVTFVVISYYVSENTYKFVGRGMRPGEYTLWHHLYYQLDNAIFLPFHHWIGLFLIFYQYTDTHRINECMIRYSSKSRWYREMLRQMFLICLKAELLGVILMLAMGAMRFGLPNSFAWGSEPPTNQPVAVMLLTAPLCRINISFFGAVVYMLALLWKKDGKIAYLLCVVYFLVCHVVLRLTPPYMSFDRIVFASCYTYHYISSGLFLEKLAYAFGLPLLCEVILVPISLRSLRRFPEGGRVDA